MKIYIWKISLQLLQFRTNISLDSLILEILIQNTNVKMNTNVNSYKYIYEMIKHTTKLLHKMYMLKIASQL